MSNNNIKIVNGKTYILEDGRWITAQGYEVDPHDPYYLSIYDLNKSKNLKDEKD